MLIQNQEQITKKDDTIKVGKKLKVEFTNITHDGMGICKINGENQYGETYSNFPLFVLGALPNEEGIVEIEKLHKTYGYAKLIRILAVIVAILSIAGIVYEIILIK